MKTIAEKSGGALFLLFLGIVVSALFGVSSIIVQAKGWEIFLAFSVLFFIVAAWGIVYELKRPKVLIKTDFKTIWVYCKSKWKSIPIEDIVKIDFHNSRSSRMELNFGTLKIHTKNETVKVYNVKDLHNVAMNITAIKNNYIGEIKESNVWELS